jgi:hypothetical protein
MNFEFATAVGQFTGVAQPTNAIQRSCKAIEYDFPVGGKGYQVSLPPYVRFIKFGQRMRDWQAAVVLLLACYGTATASRELQVPEIELEKRGTHNAGTIQRTFAFDPAATAQLDEGFVRDLTGENSTDFTSSKKLTFNLTSPAGTNLSRRTVAEVNREAPLLTVPLRGNNTLSTKPHLSVQNPGIKIGRAPDDKLVHSMQDLSILPGGSGATLDLLVGVRIATPGWGSGFNFCIGNGSN